MSFVSSLTQKITSYISDSPRSASGPAQATPGASQPVANASTASLSGASEVPRAGGGSAVTNSQGQYARLALGSSESTAIGGVGGNGGNISACEAGGTTTKARLDEKYDSSLKTNGKEALNPESKDSRLNDLKGLSQLDKNDGTAYDEHRCGASTVVAGVYYAKGTEGLKNLVKDMEAYGKKHKLDLNPYGTDPSLKKRLESGKLTKDDLNQLQDSLHSMMQARQDNFLESKGKADEITPGIGSNVLKEFVSESSHTKKTFDDNNLVIGHVDTDRKDGGNHFILAGTHNDKPFVYDPFSVKGSDGKLDNVTQDLDRLRVYRDSLSVQDNNQKYVYSQADVPFSQN